MKLELNESQNTEFKQIWKDEYIKWFIAFLNNFNEKKVLFVIISATHPFHLQLLAMCQREGLLLYEQSSRTTSRVKKSK